MTSAAEMLASKNKSKTVEGDGASDEEDDGGMPWTADAAPIFTD